TACLRPGDFLGPVCAPGGMHMSTTKFFPPGRRRPLQGPFVHLLGLVACMFIESRRPAGTTTCLLSFARGDHKNKGRKAFPPVIPRDRPGMSGHRPLTRSVRMARRAAMGACSA